MKNGQDLTDADIERSQAFLGAVLGVDEEGHLPPDHQIGANYPPEPIVDPEDKRVADLIANANDWARLHPKIETEEIAVAATDWLNQLDKDWDKIEARRVAERAPLNERLKAIQARYLPWLNRIDICRQAIRGPHTAYKRLAEQQRKAREAEAARVAAEAQRRADQLAEQAKAGGPNAISQTIVALEASQEAERARQVAAAVPKRTQIRGALGGRTHSLRTVWKAEIVEQELLYRHFHKHRDVIDVLQRLANAAARSGVRNPALPGCSIYSEES
jgi:hypothetical protein